MQQENKKAFVVSVNMGFGHMRASYPLKDIAEENKIISANDYPNIPEKDKKIWDDSQKFYEFISNFTRIPFLGKYVFKIFDQFQKISKTYPKENFVRATLSLRQIYKFIKKGWGKNLIESLEEKKLPVISTFFVPAFMADYNNYSGKIFCIATDTDISRTWAPLEPAKSKIIYLTPTSNASRRLISYGVKEENIIYTGFPLPKENVGDETYDIARKDLAKRILNLDPSGVYRQKNNEVIQKNLGSLPSASDHPLTLMFSIGGAGAQQKLAVEILNSLKEKIKTGQICLSLAIGCKEEIWQEFDKIIKEMNLTEFLGSNLKIIKEKNVFDYFDSFNRALRETDILWTKPSELSFYASLGIPIIIAPTIGSQEDFNKEWLIKNGAGIPQNDPRYINEWFFDHLEKGIFAETAMQAFINLEKGGTHNIEKIIKENQ